MPSISSSIGLKIKKLRSLFVSRANERKITNGHENESVNVGLLEESEQKDEISSTRLPISIPVLLLRSITKTRFEMVGEALESIFGGINEEVPCTNLKKGVIVAHNDNAYAVGRAVGSLISGITQLWLDSRVNSQFVRGLIDAFVDIESNQRFNLTQLTVISNETDTQIDTISRLILLTRKSLRSIRLRRVLISECDSACFLWNSIGQCSLLDNIEYEPRKKDRISRSFIIDALEGKNLDSLILSSVDDLTVTDLISIASTNGLSQLRVKGSLLYPSSLINDHFNRTLVNLDTLLIHIDTNFSLYDSIEREALLILLSSLKETATLEVVHGAVDNPTEVAKIVSYWLHLADETNRQVKLKMEGIHQELQDSAVGRLMRKVQSVHRIDWSPHQLSLSNKKGRVILLDCASLFGNE
ncbi:hypothetical protein PFISCL1PPCAC_29191 [Pristionchus fissidentatus]|uniref:F-box domain-containing protein n=1 Tax=Pristionchus fissidentatus TaxID=1538716 RepID=A0AAV5VWI6_9BILA|nr:hypothetical protein PFISCL1PPCAC_15226 [Pristionchus fissidentatus]GMT37894.1 hypothetical protein PFISCL1PPCAC_29191 [Pristionchus fissidentatus]